MLSSKCFLDASKITIITYEWASSVIVKTTHYSDSEPTSAFSPYCCVLSREATYTNFIVFSFTRSGLEPTIYRTRGEHAYLYTTHAYIFFERCDYRKPISSQNKTPMSMPLSNLLNYNIISP
jgi:hypothetical protein